MGETGDGYYYGNICMYTKTGVHGPTAIVWSTVSRNVLIFVSAAID